MLLGGSGGGKTSLGRLLAFRMALPFHDLDAVIEGHAGRAVAELFEARGEAAFRALESELLPGLLAAPAVVALGGGAWEAEANRLAVDASGFAALWLAETPARAWERAGRDPKRPLAQDPAVFMARWRRRMPAWAQADMLLAFGHSSRDLASALLD